MKLNEIRNNSGAARGKTRVGRGIASGKGGTAGRGMKGQKSRSGVSIKGFEGGQMPIHRRVPKRGFKNIFGTSYAEANIGRIQKALDDKKLSAAKKITRDTLYDAGVIGSKTLGVKLLGKGELKTKIDVEVAKASAGAIKAVEKAGGKVTVLEAKKETPAKEPKVKAKPKAEVEDETPAEPEAKAEPKAEAEE